MIERIESFIDSLASSMFSYWPASLLVSFIPIFLGIVIFRMPKERSLWIEHIKRTWIWIFISSLPSGVVSALIFVELLEVDTLVKVQVLLFGFFFSPIIMTSGYIVSLLGQKSYLDRMDKIKD